MVIMRSSEGELYTPGGHDETVVSRKLFNPSNGCSKLDAHITTFAAGAGMGEEVHEVSDHVFYLLSGSLELLGGGGLIGRLGAGDAVFIPAGEAHQLRNPGPNDGIFLAITTLA